MNHLKTLCLATALACTIAPAAAQSAKKVLYLSTAEIPGVGPGGPSLQTRSFNGFRTAAGGAANIIDGQGVLTNGTLTAADFATGGQYADVDTVVAVSIYNTITTNNMSVLQNLIATRPDLSFAMFLDGCCNSSINLNPMVNHLRNQTGWSTLGTMNGPTTFINSPLNTNSPYSTSFAAVNPFDGNAYDLLTNVPGANALYLAHGATLPATLTTPTNAYGMIVPQKAMAAGAGACTMLVADTSHFDVGTQNVDIAAATLKAIRDSNGSCQGATVEPDLTPVINGPSYLAPGTAQNYSVTVSNVGLSGMAAAPAGTVTIALPTGMTPVPLSLPTNCTWTAPNIVCTGLPAIAAGASSPTINFSATSADTMTSATLQATVGGTLPGELNKANNSAGTGSTGGARARLVLGLMQRVPTLDMWGLGALAGLLGVAGARRQRRRNARR